MLRRVGIPAVERRVDAYPHQLSGGMRQRVMIAMALINSPQLLIADEPTTALDVTVQAQILELISSLQAEFGTTVILITHDLGIVADVADDVAVMYGGRIVEVAPDDGAVLARDALHARAHLVGAPHGSRAARAARPDSRQPAVADQPAEGVRLPAALQLLGPSPGGACLTVRPELLASEPDHLVRCHLKVEERREICRELASCRSLAGGSAIDHPAGRGPPRSPISAPTSRSGHVESSRAPSAR